MHILTVHDKFTLQKNILYKDIQDSDEIFDGLPVSRSIALTILINT